MLGLHIDPIELFKSIPPELAVPLIAMLPSLELSIAIPAGITWGLPWWETYILALAGNVLPMIAIPLLIEPVSQFMRKRWKIWDRFFTWLFERTRVKFYDKHHKWGDFALFMLVAIPLPIPFSGVWSGSLAAWLFGIPLKRSFPIIFVGISFAGVVATLVSLGVINLL